MNEKSHNGPGLFRRTLHAVGVPTIRSEAEATALRKKKDRSSSEDAVLDVWDRFPELHKEKQATIMNTKQAVFYAGFSRRLNDLVKEAGAFRSLGSAAERMMPTFSRWANRSGAAAERMMPTFSSWANRIGVATENAMARPIFSRGPASIGSAAENAMADSRMTRWSNLPGGSIPNTNRMPTFSRGLGAMRPSIPTGVPTGFSRGLGAMGPSIPTGLPTGLRTGNTSATPVWWKRASAAKAEELAGKGLWSGAKNMFHGAHNAVEDIGDRFALGAQHGAANAAHLSSDSFRPGFAGDLERFGYGLGRHPVGQSMHNHPGAWGLGAGAVGGIGAGAQVTNAVHNKVEDAKRQRMADAPFGNRLAMALQYLVRPQDTANRLF